MQNTDSDRGVDLIFLSELPIGIIPDRSGNPPKSVTFELKGKPGKREAKKWTIEAESCGLPTLVDMQIFICLMAYTQEQGFPKTTQFSRSWILRDLGWAANQQSYERIQLGIDRLLRTTYIATNHYPDPKGRTYRERTAFHLLQQYQIHDSRYADAQLPPSWFLWSDQVGVLLQTPQMKQLDFAFFRSLNNPLAQAAYRYLHTRQMNGKSVYQENLIEYACERLGVSRNYRWPADLKRTLDGIHAELIEKGFIEPPTYERMKAEKGERPQQKIVIRFPNKPAPPAAPDPSLPHPLVERLVAVGVTPAVAADLVERLPEGVETQLDYWPDRAPSRYKNPAGALVKAIEQSWAAPEGWRRRQKPPREAPLPARAEAPASADAAQAAFDAWWAQLPEDQRAAFTAQARAELIGESQLIARHYERHPDRLPEALRPILMKLAPAPP
jgi:Replication initiator protein A